MDIHNFTFSNGSEWITLRSWVLNNSDH